MHLLSPQLRARVVRIGKANEDVLSDIGCGKCRVKWWLTCTVVCATHSQALTLCLRGAARRPLEALVRADRLDWIATISMGGRYQGSQSPLGQNDSEEHLR